MRRACCWTALGMMAVALCGHLPVNAQVPDAKKSKDDKAGEISAAIRDLGNDSFNVRTAARKKLLAIGLAAAGKQLKEATKSEDSEVARAATDILEQFRKERLAKAKVHVIGLYEARDKDAVVEVDDPETPVILVLCAYETVKWVVKPTEKSDVVQIIASGYHRQQVNAEGIPTTVLTYEDKSVGPDGQPYYFFTYDHDEERYPEMAEKVRSLTGKKVSSFQGRYSFRKVPFRVGTVE